MHILFILLYKYLFYFLGGESIYGGPFKDEFHSRLRFARRGLVAMASSGPDTNLSQFFITLDKTEELQRRHTVSLFRIILKMDLIAMQLFGKVTGDTVFNALKMNEYEVDENDKPLFPPKISFPYMDFEDILL